MTPEPLLLQMYLALHAMPCRCVYERNALGVPVWVGNDRVLVEQCSRHKATDAFEALYPEHMVKGSVT